MTRPAAWKILLYAAALFAAGVVCGAMVMSHLTPVEQPLKLGRTGEIVAKIRAKLTARLQLTPAQQEQFEPLFEKISIQLESIHKECLDKILAALDQMHADMSPALTPDQRQLLKALEAERQQAMLQKYNYTGLATNPAAR